MAALTWREVAAPDFGTSLQGIGQFSRLLDNAFSGAESAVGKFDAAQDEMANRDILERMYAYNDPLAFAAAKADGSILGPDARRASGATLAALNQQVGTLQNQALGAINLEATGRENEQAKYQDSIGQQVLEWERLRADPNGQKAAAAFLAANPQIQDASKLGFRNAASILNAGMGMEERGLGLANTRQGMDLAMRAEGRAAEQFDWSKVDRNEARQVAQDYTNALAQGFDADSMEGFIADNKITGQRAALLRQAFMGGGAGGAGGVGGAGVGGDLTGGLGGGGGGGYRGYMSTLESGGSKDPDSASNPLSSAYGRYQITNPTWLGTIKKANPSWARGKSDAQLLALKANPQYQDMVETALRADNTRALQAAGLPVTNANLYSMHHFGNTKFARASNDTPISQILTPEQIAANPYLKGMTKGQVLNNWTARTGINPGSLAVSADISRDTAQRRALAKDPTGFNERVLKAQTAGPGDIDTVTAQIAKDTGADPSDVRRQLAGIMNAMQNSRAPGGWGVAGEIYKESRKPVSKLNSYLHSWTDTSSAGSGQVIDNDAIRTNIAKWKTASTSAVSRDRMGTEGAEAAKAAALKVHADKYARYQNLVRRQAAGAPISATVLRKAEKELAEAEDRAKELVGGRIAEDEADAAQTGLGYTGGNADAQAAAGRGDVPIVLEGDVPTAGQVLRHAALGPAGIALLGQDFYRLLRTRQALANSGQVPAAPAVEEEPRRRGRGLLGYGGLGGDGFATTNQR